METDKLQNKVITRLNERFGKHGKELACPLCSNKNFIVADAFFVNILQPDINKMTLSGKSVPTIGIMCDNCGFMSQHSLGILGLLSAEENK